MNYVRAARWSAPEVQPGCFVYEWATDCTETIQCVLEYEPETGDGWDEPRYPERTTFCEAWLRGVEITCFITDEQAREIEQLAHEQRVAEAREEAAERAYDRSREEA